MSSVADVVGRKVELRSLERFLDTITTGSAAVRLEGEAGSGKTTLWQETVKRARERHLRVLVAQPVEAERELAFATLGDLLSGEVADAIGTLPAPQRRALQVALLLAEPAQAPPDQRAVGAAVLGLLRLLAEDGVLIAVDDLQWLDASSAAALKFALRRIETERIGVAAALRREEGTPDELELGRIFGERLERIDVPPLSADDIARLLEARLGSMFHPPTIRRVHKASGGNPFFALELGRALIDKAMQPIGDELLPLPATLRELVHMRVKQLSPATRDALLPVAATARPTEALVGAIIGESAEDALREAVAANVIRRESDVVRFTHPLLATVLYDESLASRRREVHALLATQISDVEERARHVALAALAPDANIAAALDDAAAVAAARGAAQAAADHVERALRLTPSDDTALQHQRRLAAAEYHEIAGDSRRAQALLEQAVEAAPRGRLRGEALLRLAMLAAETETASGAIDLFQRGLAEADGDPALLSALHANIAFWQSHFCLDPRSNAEAAMRFAEQAGDPKLLADALCAVAYGGVLAGVGLADETVKRVESIEQHVDYSRANERPSFVLGAMQEMVGDLDAARERLERVCSAGRAAADATVAFPLTSLASTHLVAGRWEQAAATIEEAAEIAHQVGRELPREATETLRAQLYAGRGDVDAALKAAAHVGPSPNDPWLALGAASALGSLELSRANPAAAKKALLPAFEILERLRLPETASVPLTPLLHEALVALGELDEARTLLERMERAAAALRRPWARAYAMRGHGFALSATGCAADALVAFEEARAEHEKSGQPFELARTLLALGSAQRRARQRKKAGETVAQSLAIFEQLGAKLWAERAQAELTRLGGRPSQTGRLSETERQIAELVARGRSNAEVAHELFVSPKTVEWNLSKIYKKLHVRSRAELAAKLAK